ncbi:hypothetical protein [uncultured Eubacterium sp.]|uniref:hypothetical protein n=1 Tax=uncultured Eubacterium sp. TaxID=165185 RepID=UPI0025980CD3|nr:hypothetical protein [uncultured Eubacterium sp.]
MTYEMYQTIFWYAGVLTIIFAVGDVLLFVVLKIPKVIGQLSGRTARKGIADIWKQNVQTGGKCYKICAENQNFGSIAGGMTESGNTYRFGETMNTGGITQKIVTSEIGEKLETSETMLLPIPKYAETMVLNDIDMDDNFVIEEICFIHTKETIG